MHLFKEARLLALEAVLGEIRGNRRYQEEDYILRDVLRTYSERFHTPLDQVYQLPLEFVLQQVWEARYKDLLTEEADEKDLDQRPPIEREREFLCETEEEAAAREALEQEDEMDEDELVENLRKENEKILAAAKKVTEAMPPGFSTSFDEDE